MRKVPLLVKRSMWWLAPCAFYQKWPCVNIRLCDQASERKCSQQQCTAKQMAEKSCQTRHLSTGMVLLVAYTDKKLVDSLRYVITHNDLSTSRTKHPKIEPLYPR